MGDLLKHYRVRDVFALSLSPLGRARIREGIGYRTWPIASRVAWLHRRTLARSTRVIAVVGSLGKTTTRRAITAALALPPNEYHFNAWNAIVRSIVAIRRGQHHAAIEVGIGDKGQMRPYASVVRPDVTVVTSVASEHHRSLGTLDVTRDEKAWMVRALGPGGVAVLNGDDPNVMWMAGETRARVVTYGFGAHCDVRAEDLALDWPRGMRFRILASGRSHDSAIRLLGRHMVYPALAAFAVATLEGVAPDEALARIASVPPGRARMEPVPLPGGAFLLRDEFKSTTESIDAALDLLETIPARRLVVLGGISEPVGPQWRAYRRIAERVGRIADRFVICGHGHEKYRPGAIAAGMAPGQIVYAAHSPRRAAEFVAAMVQPGDVVLVKGRDTEKLDRIHLILAGRKVRCDIESCDVRTVSCASCPMLERGWNAGEGPP